MEEEKEEKRKEGMEEGQEDRIKQTPVPQYHEPRAISFLARQKPWVNVLLFAVTVVSCFLVGLTWSVNYVYADEIVNGLFGNIGIEEFMNPDVIWFSAVYAIVLIGILLAHEMGHYLTCRYYGINATLPFFIPFPPPSPIGKPAWGSPVSL